MGRRALALGAQFALSQSSDGGLMKAARIHSFGGPEILQVEDVEVPTPKSGEVLVRVSAASVNPVDYKIRQGGFPKITEKDLPMILGRDVCGTVQGIPGSRTR